MKLTTFILITTFLHVSATTLAQKVTLEEKNVPLATVFNDITSQIDYDFVCTTDALKDTKNVTVNVKNQELSEVLDQLLKNQNLDYVIENKSIAIKVKEVSLLDKIKDKITEIVTNITVTGQVVDETGTPLPGATVKLKDGNQATVTDAKGYFTLNQVKLNASIQISFIGYTQKEITVKDDLGVIVMHKSTDKLDEIQVIAYGETSLRTSTGSVTTIKGNVIDKQPVTNILGAIEGRVPGLFIQQNTGLPDATYSMLIRGKSSINSASVPLVVIDGLPYQPGVLAGGAGSGPSDGTALNYIDVSNIESIDVLKDADATSIYGSRGANGVILITTKKGKAGQVKVEGSIEEGYQREATLQPFLNTQEYLQFRKQAFSNDSITIVPGNGNYDVDGTWNLSSYSNWQKMLIGNTSHYTDTKANISGGTQSINYLVGADYNQQSTIFPGEFGDKRGSLHFNLNSMSANNKFRMILTGQFTTDRNNTIQSDLSQFITLAPDAPAIYTSAGTLNWANSTWTNPYSFLLDKNIITTDNLISGLNLSYNLLPGLDIKTDLGYNFSFQSGSSSTPISSQDPSFNPINSASFSNQYTNGFSIEPQIAYKIIYGKELFNILIGGSIQQQSSKGTSIYASNYSTDALLGSLSGASNYIGSSIALNTYRYSAIYARVNYAFDDKYILDLNGRRDGSSRFGPGNQIANFGSIAGAWIFSKEKWLEDISVIDFGKIRVSYGVSGNDQIGDYQYFDLYKTVPNQYEGVAGVIPSSVYNTEFSWEKNRKLNLGVDMGFLKDRIIFSSDIYRQISNNELINFPLPSFVGPGGVQVNSPATIRNEGIEFSLTTVNVKNKSFQWQSVFNISANRNTLLAYPNLSASGLQNLYYIGHSLTSYPVFKEIGVDPKTGVYQYLTAGGQITNTPTYLADQTVFEDLAPKYFGGLNNEFSYKGFHLSFFLEFVKQNGYNPALMSPIGTSPENIPQYLWNNMWHQAGDVSKYEKATSSYGSAAYSAWTYASTSTLDIINASYIRLKTAAISYSIPQFWTKHLGLNSARIYLECQNLYTFTGFHSDPEIQNYSSASGLLRTIVMGLQLDL